MSGNSRVLDRSAPGERSFGMSKPDEQQSQQEQDHLDLDPETVDDLDVDEPTADAVRGGPGNSGHPGCVSP